MRTIVANKVNGKLYIANTDGKIYTLDSFSGTKRRHVIWIIVFYILDSKAMKLKCYH